MRLPRPDSALSRRSLLRGAALGGASASMGMAGCAYLPSDPGEPAKPLPRSAKARIDGDLVYFNWADYLAPAVIKGFQEEYGVEVIESNFDSWEGMYAKIAAGNAYDIIFPGAKWVVKMKRERKLRAIDHAELDNADQVFYSGSYFADPWYDADSECSVPFTAYKTGIAWRTDHVDGMTGSWRDLWNEDGAGRIFMLNDVDECFAVAALLLDLPINTSEPSDLEQIKRLLIDQKRLVRTYSNDDINNMTGGNAWIHHMWSGDFLYMHTALVDEPDNYAFASPSEGTPINSDCYAIPANAEHPGTAMVFIDYLLRPEVAVKNINYLCYPVPVRDAEPAFDELAKASPEIAVSLADLENRTVFELLDPPAVQRRNAAWVEIKAS